MVHKFGVGLFAAAGLLATGVHAKGAVEAAPVGECHQAAVEKPIMLSADQVKWVAVPPSLPAGGQFALLEGAPAVAGKLVTFRLKLPAGYRIPPHVHGGDEHVTVLSGALRMGLGDKVDTAKASEMKTGGFMVIPAKQPHYVVASEDSIVQVYSIGPWSITYLNPADDPRNKKK